MRYSALLIFACACNHQAPGAAAQQAAELRRAGQLPEAFAHYAGAVCVDTDNLDVAREFVATWDALGRPGEPAQRLDCQLPAGTAAYMRGLVATQLGEYAAAAEAFAAAFQSVATAARGDVRYRHGLAMLQAGDPAAVALLAESAVLAPERIEVRLALAQAHLKNGDAENAVRNVLGAADLELAPGDVPVAQNILRRAVVALAPPLSAGVEAELQEALGQLAQGRLALEDYARLQRIGDETGHPRVLTVVGIAALQLGALPDGQRLLDRAAALNPHDPDPPRALGLSLLAGERYSDAVVQLREALRRDPFDATVAAKLAGAAERVKDGAAAVAAYRALVRLEAGAPDHYLRLARLQRQTGDLVGAQLAVERAYGLDAHNISLLLERAVIHARLARSAPTPREREQAEQRTRASVRELLALAPEHPGASAILESLED